MKTKNTLNVIINLVIAAYILSFLINLMHWFQIGSIRSIISLFLALLIGVQFFLTKQKSFISYVSLVASIIIIVAFINSFFNVGILRHLEPFTGTSVLFIIITHGTRFNQKKYIETDSLDDYEFGKEDNLEGSYLSIGSIEEEESKNKIPQIAFGTSVGLIVIGMLFKFMHYPGASILNTLGFTGAIICVLYYTFTSSKK